MGNDGLSSKQVGSQACRQVAWRLAWIQPVCISINVVPALKGLTSKKAKKTHFLHHIIVQFVPLVLAST